MKARHSLPGHAEITPWTLSGGCSCAYSVSRSDFGDVRGKGGGGGGGAVVIT